MKFSLSTSVTFTLGIVAIVIGFIRPAAAADHLNLEEGLPVEVEDAYPVPKGGREIQGVFRYDREEGEDLFKLESRLEYGFAPNWQGRVTVPFEFGSGDDDFGDVGVEVFYNFNTETLNTPAFALSLSADLPTSPDSAGVDPTLKFIATQSIGTGDTLDRFHLNLSYGINTERQDEERRDRFGAVIGYSRRLGSEAMLVADVVFEEEEEEDREAVLLEAGLRYQTHPQTVLSIGAGVGLTEESPDFRITAGFQQSF